MKKVVIFALTIIFAMGCVKSEDKNGEKTEKKGTKIEKKDPKGKKIVKKDLKKGKKGKRVEKKEPPLTFPDVVAKVNGEEIKKDELLKQLKRVEDQFKRFKQHIRNSQKKSIAKNLLDKIIKEKLITIHAESLKLSPKDEEIEKEFSSYRKRFKKEEDFKKFLDTHKLTEDKIKSEIKKRILNRTVIEKEVVDKIKLDAETVKKYYETNKDKFAQKEQLRARHILAKASKQDKKEKHDEAMKKIKEIEAKLKKSKGADFAQLATKFSEGPSKRSGGMLPWFGRGRMDKNFENAAFDLKKGEISPIVKSAFGYHLIKLEDKKEKKQLSFDEVKERIERRLKHKEIRKNLKAFYNSLKVKYKVETFI